ncbi:hypothetical protein [Flavobacterium sp.]|uniref:hypothetical protein n=1 Tax=Flavobacterium sp. TaxID=239 RepID=UPI0031D8DEFD
MKAIYKLGIMTFVFFTVLFFSCKSGGTTVAGDSDAIKAGDSTSLNSGSKGTTRANEGNEDGDPQPGDLPKK